VADHLAAQGHADVPGAFELAGVVGAEQIAGVAGGGAVGLAGHGVEVDHAGGDAGLRRGLERRAGDEPAGGEHRACAGRADQVVGLALGRAEGFDEPDQAARVHRERFGADGGAADLEFFEDRVVDVAFADDEARLDLDAELFEAFEHGGVGVDVPARAAADKQDGGWFFVHRLHRLRRFQGVF